MINTSLSYAMSSNLSCHDSANSFIREPFFGALPIDVVQNTVVDFKADVDGLLANSIVDAPSSISATDIELTPINRRLLPGQAAVFKLVPTAAPTFLKHHKQVLSALASIIEATATLCTVTQGTDMIDMHVPVSIEASEELSLS